MDTEQLRLMLAGINHRLKRNKALPKQFKLRLLAIDGYEFFSFKEPLLRPVLL
jgi:hypothetical protein